ncbi:MAG: acyl-ACP--UDP-N-acetylglucosamine O-acyltransferase [Ignavibacteriaceae bacterium]
MPKIHPSSVVSSKAQISADAEIGPFCFIEDDVIIGSGTKLLNNVTVYNGARIGENNLLFPGSVISAIPQDLKFGGEITEAVIGNNNRIRECVTVNRGTSYSGSTIVGNNCLLMAYSHVAHDCIIGDNCILANSVALGGHVTLEEYTILGGLVGVHQFVKVGRHCMIGAHSMLVKDVPPFTLFSGDPLHYKGLNITGLKRRDFSSDKIELLKKVYHIIYSSGLNVTQSIEKLKKDFKQEPEIPYIISFIESSSRGISR